MTDDLSKPCIPCLSQVPVTVEADNSPTARVVLLEPMPQIVEVRAHDDGDEVILSLHDGTFELPDAVALWPISAHLPNQSGIVLAMDAAAYRKLEERGLETWRTVERALNRSKLFPVRHTPNANTFQETLVNGVVVKVPEFVGSIVSVVPKGHFWQILSVDHVDLGDHLFAVISPGNQPDIVVAANLDFVAENPGFEEIVKGAIDQLKPTVVTLPILKRETVPDILQETRRDLVSAIKAKPETPKRPRKKSIVKKTASIDPIPDID